jgi:hypothetical protein
MTSVYHNVSKTSGSKFKVQLTIKKVSICAYYVKESHAAWHYNLWVDKYSLDKEKNNIEEPKDFVEFIPMKKINKYNGVSYNESANLFIVQLKCKSQNLILYASYANETHAAWQYNIWSDRYSLDRKKNNIDEPENFIEFIPRKERDKYTGISYNKSTNLFIAQVQCKSQNLLLCARYTNKMHAAWQYNLWVDRYSINRKKNNIEEPEDFVEFIPRKERNGKRVLDSDSDSYNLDVSSIFNCKIENIYELDADSDSSNSDA